MSGDRAHVADVFLLELFSSMQMYERRDLMFREAPVHPVVNVYGAVNAFSETTLSSGLI